MVYAAGGLETGELDSSSIFVARGAGGSPALAFTDADKLHVGFNVGAGVEYALTNNVFLGVEYRYIDLGKQTYNLGAFTPAGAAAQTVTNAGLASSACKRPLRPPGPLVLPRRAAVSERT